MANKKKGVSSKTHTQKQLDDYANQHNPNNKAYKANQANMAKSKKHNKDYIDNVADLEWFCYGWCDDLIKLIQKKEYQFFWHRDFSRCLSYFLPFILFIHQKAKAICNNQIAFYLQFILGQVNIILIVFICITSNFI